MRSGSPSTSPGTPIISTERRANRTGGSPMAQAGTQEKPAAETERELTDGFQLVIDALKLHGINTIYGVPGIPMTALGRMAQSAVMRVISFRHEQNAGNAA